VIERDLAVGRDEAVCSRRLLGSRTSGMLPRMAKDQDKKRSAKTNKPKLTAKEKKEKKLAKQGKQGK
jgi:hypothetical protein